MATAGLAHFHEEVSAKLSEFTKLNYLSLLFLKGGREGCVERVIGRERERIFHIQ